MRTYKCCEAHCRIRTHVVFALGSTMRDDHPYPCAKCADGDRGRELVEDTAKLPQMRAS